MEMSDLLRHASDLCDRLSLTYLVTGSTATIAYGEPRFTNDIDMVVDLPAEWVGAFCAGFPETEFYVSLEAVARAVQARHQFNVLHSGSGLKIDFIVMTESEFDQSRRSRKRNLSVLPGRPISFASPEDVILKKLTYFQEGGSEKHLRDIAGVLRIQGEAIDQGYLETWAAKLGVGDLWRQIVQTETTA